MSLIGWYSGTGASGFGYDSTAEEVTHGRDLSGKTILVTGCNSGLGQETCRVLAKRGATLIGAARTQPKADAALSGLQGSHRGVPCDLSEPDHVRRAVATVQDGGGTIDAIIANAGIMALPERTVKHGLELQFLTNHIGHYLLVTGLLPQLADDGRIVMLSSAAHVRAYPEGIRLDDLDAAKDYTAWGSYGQSKLANLLFAKHLATRLGPDQTANSVHPGVIWTNLGRHMPASMQAIAKVVAPVALKSIARGAATQCYVATHPDAAQHNGEYFADSNVARTSRNGRDQALATALWEKTEALVAGM